MADTVNATAPTWSVIATTSSRVKELPIKNGQLIFVQDKGRIAFDFKDKRVFYNQITEIDTEQERATLSDPMYGYYFVIETAVLWTYQGEWIALTSRPEEVLFIGVELPELGQAKTGTLYVDIDDKEISVYDEESNTYITVSNYTGEISDADIEELFK